MGFDLNVIPPASRSKAQISEHLALYKESLDTCKIHNPSSEDFKVYNDRMVSNEKWVIPNANKDIGYGKGNQHVPRFIAKRYLDKMGMEMINKMIEDDWNKKKKQYNTIAEQRQMEERYALKSSDPKLWDEITPKLFLGVVERYGGDQIEEDVEETKPELRSGSYGGDALDRLGLADTDVEVLEDQKSEFIESVT